MKSPDEKNNSKKSGLILVDKPSGITSHDVVDIVRRKLNCRKVGHAGTLDPLAEGLLLILVGSYTKMFGKFVTFDKEYTGTLKLGETTTTGDSEGRLTEKKDYRGVSREQIEKTFDSFKGAIEQIPPMVSALRKKGKRLYKLARKGVTVDREPRRVNIYRCDLKKINLPYLDFYVHCSKGTYIRKLSEDIGDKLGCGAHVTKIVRQKVGCFCLDNAVKPREVNESCLQKITF